MYLEVKLFFWFLGCIPCLGMDGMQCWGSSVGLSCIHACTPAISQVLCMTSFENFLTCGLQRDNTVDKLFAMHLADPGLIPGIPYGSPSTTRRK